MVDYAVANQIRPFQAPDVAGIAGAMQSLELNQMRMQQLRAAEQERNALRGLMSDPNFDVMSPDASRRILSVAPLTGAPVYQATVAGRREQRQGETAAAESLLKNFDVSRQSLRGIAALPEAERPRAWAAWRAQTEAALPTTRGFIPAEYSSDAYAAMISQADEIAKNLTERPTALAGPGGVPVFADRTTGTYRMGTEVPGGAAAPAAPAARAAPAPRAEAPSLDEPGRDMAAAMLRRSEGFRAEPYMDVNALRAGYGSDTITTADGRVVPVTQGTRVTQEDAERDLARRVPEFERRAAAAVGEERFAALPPNARAALISVAYNYGTLPARIRNAVQSGDVNAIAAAVEGLAGDNQGINARRRREEAAVIRGANAMAPAATPVNAMAPPPDATAMTGVPQLPSFAPPRTLAEADYQKRIMDAVTDLEKKRLEAERARGEQPARVQEAGQTVSAQETARIQARETEAKRAEAEKLNIAISELERISRPGGLLERSTGSGIGRLVDIAGEFVGMSSRGAQAAAALAPIADVVLKMVPRFEGPQSDKDTATYQNAAGRLADPTVPNETRLAAAREIVRLMRDRRDQFTFSGGGTTPAASTEAPAVTPRRPAPPQPGTVQDGYRFKGGDPANAQNWERL